jgi:hypothetical protein
MTLSYSQPVDLACPACGQPFTADAWLIVDAQERPELAAAVSEGTIHDVRCPHCGQAGAIPAPLLYHDPQRRRVLFAVPPGMDEAAWREEAQGLLWTLIGRLPEAQRLPYLGELQAEAGLAGLALALRAVPTSSVEALGEALAADEDEIPLLVEAVLALLEVQSAAQAQRVFAAYPFLLDETMDVGLADLAAAAREQGEQEAAVGFERARAIMAELQPLVRATPQGEERAAAGGSSAPDAAVEQAAGPASGAVPAPEQPAPPEWPAALGLLLDPTQEADLAELQAQAPILANAQAGAWLAREIAQRRAVGQLMEVQLLQEWQRQLQEQRSGAASG